MLPHTVRVHTRGVDALPSLAPLWNALFDHHLSIGAAGLPSIPRAESWPRREQHYRSIFAHEPGATVWVATIDAEPVGYALAYEENLHNERALLLETLSVLPSARGHGIGTQLMWSFDEAAKSAGIENTLVDVMSGNARARQLYLRHGFTPHTESWMRSTPPRVPASGGVDLARIAEASERLGLRFHTSPGLDDTWVSAKDIADLHATGSTTWVTSPITAKFFGDAADFDRRNAAALRALFTQLEAAGLWTIRVEVPAAPATPHARNLLREASFRMSTERLARC